MLFRSKGSAELLVALRRNDVQFASDAVAAVLPHIKAGALRGLAVGSQERLTFLPEVPTLAEAGVSGVDFNVWYGVLAPARTPPQVVRRVADGLAAVVADAEFRAQLANIQFETFYQGSGAFQEFIQKELGFWQQFFQATGIKLEQ